MTEDMENRAPKRRAVAAFILFGGLSIILSACSSHSAAFTLAPVDITLPRRIQLLEDSARLYERGAALEDPVAMALAAEMRADALGGWNAIPVESPLSPVAYLERAKTIASGDAASGEFIRRIEQRRRRGGADGPFIREASIGGGMTFNHQSAFEPGLPAVVYVESAHPADFALLVEDASEDAVCLNNGSTPRKICRWSVASRVSYSINISSDAEDAFNVLIIVN